MNGVLLYAALFVLTLAPGLPLGWALFGRRHAAGWICGATIGYALTSLALWVPVRVGTPRASFFIASWLAMVVVSWVAHHEERRLQ